MKTIYIDADACPVKEEVYKVAARYEWQVQVVANQYIQIPLHPLIKMQVVSDGFDAADDWIVENIKQGDVLVTSDLLLADRAIKKSALVLDSKGKELDEENIGAILANRELNSHLRQIGEQSGGPSAMDKKARSQFLSTLDRLIHKANKL